MLFRKIFAPASQTLLAIFYSLSFRTHYRKFALTTGMRVVTVVARRNRALAVFPEQASKRDGTSCSRKIARGTVPRIILLDSIMQDRTFLIALTSIRLASLLMHTVDNGSNHWKCRKLSFTKCVATLPTATRCPTLGRRKMATTGSRSLATSTDHRRDPQYAVPDWRADRVAID